jgi:fumarate hydratase class II
VLSRRDAELLADGRGDGPPRWEPAAATLFLKQSARRVRESLRRLSDHDHEAITYAARRVLEAGW